MVAHLLHDNANVQKSISTRKEISFGMKWVQDTFIVYVNEVHHCESMALGSLIVMFVSNV